MSEPSATATQERPGEGYWEVEAGDVHAVEKALVRLRKEYASAEAVQEGHAGTRNSVANLVVYAGTMEDAERATEALEQLAGRHPARTILLVADLVPGEPSVTASVSARCSLARGQERLCYEEIRLLARGRSAPHLRSVIDPLLISDLPTFLWWTGEPVLREEVFRELADLCEWVLIDSAKATEPLRTLAQIGRIIEDASLEAALGDLNWDRLGMWRQTLAELFDPPQMIEMLASVRRLRIQVAGERADDPASAAALLLVGWLGAILDWEPGKPGERTFSGGARFRMRAGGHDVQVELRTAPVPNATPGELQSVALECDDGTETVRVEVSRSPGREHARTSVGRGTEEAVERVVRFQVGDDAQLLGQEVEDLERDRVFEAAAEMAGRLAALLPVGASRGG